MEAEIERAARRPAGLDRVDHVGEPDAAVVGLAGAGTVGEVQLAQPVLPRAEVDRLAIDADGAQLAAESEGEVSKSVASVP